VTVRIYVEGGGDSGSTRAACRRGFSQLIAKFVASGHLPRVIACGSRNSAWDDFMTALTDGRSDAVLLLVDAEGPVEPGSTTWAHLAASDKWLRPSGAADEDAHLMVECMESWILADRRALAEYYGRGFNAGRLPNRPDVERISKADIAKALVTATKETRKGQYHKVRHGFDLVGIIDPQVLRSASPRAAAFMDAVRARCEAPAREG
jgi:hypothetical protein